MIHIPFSLIADLMVWGTIPLWGVLGLWEHHLAGTDTDHKLLLIVFVVIVFGWAYVWDRMREQDRLAHLTSWNANHQKILAIEPGITDQGNRTLASEPDGTHRVTKKEDSTEIVENYHV